MAENRRTVGRYVDGFRTNDHEQILSCLTGTETYDAGRASCRLRPSMLCARSIRTMSSWPR